MKDLKLVLKQHPAQPTSQISIGKAIFGDKGIQLIAGPCAAESQAQLMTVAKTLQANGTLCMRAGVFKPRTSPYSFQGMGQEGLELLALVREKTGLAVISEVMSIAQCAQAQPYLDAIQVGARNMQNFELLKALGDQPLPIILKRGLSATLEELLYAAEYIMAHGNPNVILCERGIRSFDTATRNVLDISAAPVLKSLTHLPVLIDPSHATGKRHLVAPCAQAGVAVGADAIMVEIHPTPELSVSDAAQALSLDDYSALVPRLDALAHAIGRHVVIDLQQSPHSHNNVRPFHGHLEQTQKSEAQHASV